MPRFKGSPRVIRRVYAVLYEEPKSFERIVIESRLSRKTVGKVLTNLVKGKMVRRHKEGTKTIYEIEKTLSPYYGWQIPWIRLMMTRGDWDMKWKRGVSEINSHGKIPDIYRKRLKDVLYDEFIHSNTKLVEILEELGIAGTPLIRFLEDLERPYCLECLGEGRGWVRTGLSNREYTCPCCALVVEQVRVREDFQDRLYVLLRREWFEQIGLFPHNSTKLSNPVRKL
jgi:hypothetical protein